MLTPRRSAQLGLGGACLVLVSSVAVLVAGGSDAGREVPSNPAYTTSAVTPSLSVQNPVSDSASNKGALMSPAAMK
jgi:hypothetical protein